MKKKNVNFDHLISTAYHLPASGKSQMMLRWLLW